MKQLFYVLLVSSATAALIIGTTHYDTPEEVRAVCSTAMTEVKKSLGEPIIEDYNRGQEGFEFNYVNHHYLFVKAHSGCRMYGNIQ